MNYFTTTSIEQALGARAFIDALRTQFHATPERTLEGIALRAIGLGSNVGLAATELLWHALLLCAHVQSLYPAQSLWAILRGLSIEAQYEILDTALRLADEEIARYAAGRLTGGAA